MQKETWKTIKGYLDYQVSNYGRIKSVKYGKVRIMKIGINPGGYNCINLCIGGVVLTHRVHKLVAAAFLDHKTNGHKIVVDHIDGNKLNNNILNLQLISQRENCSKDKYKYAFSSKFVGVSWDKYSKKWSSQISYKNKSITLGFFDTEIEASKTYQNKLKLIEAASLSF